MNVSVLKVSELVENLHQQGVQLWADNGKLKIHSPKGILTSEMRQEIAQRKPEILAYLDESNGVSDSDVREEHLSLPTIGRLIGGYCDRMGVKPPAIDSTIMAKSLVVTFRPLPPGYNNNAIVEFRKNLETKLAACGVQIKPWEQATKEFTYELNIPFINWKKSIKTRAVKAGISAVIDVERKPSLAGKLKICVVENLYNGYTRFILKNQRISVSKIAQFISWAEENVRSIEDPTNTQVIVLTELDKKITDSQVPYQQKIPIGINTLVRTFSEIAIGVSPTHISILNMNLSDSIFPVNEIDRFVLKSLIPKIYVPIMPLSMRQFQVGTYDSTQSGFAAKLVKMGQELASTNLLPAGFKINNVIKRKSHRDIVDWMMDGRTGVSYGFVAYAEPPQYIGAREISEDEWLNLLPIEGYSSAEVRQNQAGRRYVKTKIADKYVYQQVPDIWLLTSRSGSKKTDLSLERDILRVGLKDKLYLQLPEGVDPAVADIKPSYDIYVMVAIALATALYAPKLIEDGAPIVHFHGYPSIQWFETHQYCTGVDNPSVPCGTYESGVFNFLGIYNLVNKYGSNITLACLIEPDHGTNIITSNWEYLVAKIKSGVEQQQIELGGKHFPSLKENIAVS
ncbi:hypothetical protein [Chroococcidiopsis sp. TS-821]|uniref:TubC N-terminal docking domain-related protein n=1 Tax=Chroococcidiopsis sp. TS-821 TaxID=1378066 RepID=UPI000D44623C|nr:hypothetical protein [Chroococcidiopsis sp. TS-821]PPS43908.1 non-ribosomal peptide synthase [Chroococcidiopsis sp. TS-821]